MKTWEDKTFDPPPQGISIRELAELETEHDLEKPIEQLLCDVHEEINHPGRTPEVNIAHANKRMISLMARVAISNNKVSKRLEIYTIVILALTVLTVFLTVFRR